MNNVQKVNNLEVRTNGVRRLTLSQVCIICLYLYGDDLNVLEIKSIYANMIVKYWNSERK
jgi:hypothetical protein